MARHKRKRKKRSGSPVLVVGVIGGGFVALALLVVLLANLVAPPEEENRVTAGLSSDAQSETDSRDAEDSNAWDENTADDGQQDKQGQTAPADASGEADDEFKPGGMLADSGLGDSVFAVLEGDEYEVADGMAGLLVKWPADSRTGGKISFNGDNKELKLSGPLKYDLKPGVYRVALNRPGYKEIVAVLNLVEDKLTQFRTDWKREELAITGPVRPGDIAQYQGWLQDFEEAQIVASQENKDVMIAFSGTDWCGWCIKLAGEVLHQQSFKNQIKDDLVLVLVDFPRGPIAQAQVKDQDRNEELSEKFNVDGFPTLVFTDSQGRPYGASGYIEGGVSAFMAYIKQLKRAKKERDQLFAKIESEDGDGRLEAAKKALIWLRERNLIRHYGPTLNEWYELAEKTDPQNEDEHLETFFEVRWMAGLAGLDKEDKEKIQAAVAEFETWNEKFTIHDDNRGARLNLFAAFLMIMLEKEEEARKFVEAGLAYDPDDYGLVAQLHAASSYFRRELGSGTGWIVARGGYLVTNHHVIEGPGRTVVRFRDDENNPEDVTAEIIAKDKRLDIAILKIDLPQGIDPTPIPVNAEPVTPGQRIAVFGYPLGDAAGAQLKLTTGIISSLAEKRTLGMLTLDCRVNPGNSGGPLCNTSGQCIGLITAKSQSGFGVEAYGMARPADKVENYLKQHLPGYQPPDVSYEKMEWDEVYRQVNDAVLMIVKIDDSKKEDDKSSKDSTVDSSGKDDSDSDSDEDEDKTEKARKDEDDQPDRDAKPEDDEEDENPFL